MSGDLPSSGLPGVAARAARVASSAVLDNSQRLSYLAGRMFMGTLTGLGPAAAMGSALRAVENGHNLLDSLLYQGVQGIPSPER